MRVALMPLGTSLKYEYKKVRLFDLNDFGLRIHPIPVLHCQVLILSV